MRDDDAMRCMEDRDGDGKTGKYRRAAEHLERHKNLCRVGKGKGEGRGKVR